MTIHALRMVLTRATWIVGSVATITDADGNPLKHVDYKTSADGKSKTVRLHF